LTIPAWHRNDWIDTDIWTDLAPGARTQLITLARVSFYSVSNRMIRIKPSWERQVDDLIFRYKDPSPELNVDWLTLTLRSLHRKQPDRDLPFETLVLATGLPLVVLDNVGTDMLGFLIWWAV
jgi:hypothetical protein